MLQYACQKAYARYNMHVKMHMHARYNMHACNMHVNIIYTHYNICIYTLVVTQLSSQLDNNYMVCMCMYT